MFLDPLGLMPSVCKCKDGQKDIANDINAIIQKVIDDAAKMAGANAVVTNPVKI